MLRYVICSTPRSGSSLLAKALEAMGLGRPDEYFNPVEDTGRSLVPRRELLGRSLDEYVRWLHAERAPDGVLGLKIHHSQLSAVPGLEERLDELFPGARYIAISRRGLVRQAVSLWRAETTRAWAAYLPERADPRFDRAEIERRIVALAAESERWERHFRRRRIEPLRVLYEDLDADYAETLTRVLTFLGVARPIPPRPLRRQTDRLTEKWVARLCRRDRTKRRRSTDHE